MSSTRFYFSCLAAFCLAAIAVAAEKQIKLEDIEKDTLKAAQQAKYEKQIQAQQQQQQQQPQQQQYQQTTYQYDPQVYAQQSAYQTPTSYSQYIVPQQYIPQSVVSAYGPLTSNNLGAGYATPSAHAFQAYFSPQLATIPSVSTFHASQPLTAATQTQPIYINFATPSLTAFQPQYYQDGLQYYPAQTSQATQFYYAPQTVDQTSTQLSSSLAYPATQQYLTLQPATSTQYSYQPLTSNKASTSYAQQYVSTAPQTFPAQAYSGHQQEYTSIYTPQSYSSNSVYTNTETPTFVTVKAPQHLVASQAQQQAYNQQTTISPIQTKYLNSPQYLAQNYNTIQSNQLYSKGSLSSGVKSTVSPPTKNSGASSYVSNSFGSASSSVSSYLPFRSLPPKKY